MNIVIKALLAATALIPVAAQAQDTPQPDRHGRPERQGQRADGRGNRDNAWAQRGERQPGEQQAGERGPNGRQFGGRDVQGQRGEPQRQGFDAQRGQAQRFEADRGPDRQAFAADRANDRQGFAGNRSDGGRGREYAQGQFQGGRGNVIQAGRRDRDDRGPDGDRRGGPDRGRGGYGGFDGNRDGYGAFNGNRGGYDNRGGAWNRGWRGDNRYNWSSYRQANRGAYRLPHYYAPGGWSYAYRRYSIGSVLASVLWDQTYWIDDPYSYRLPEAYGPYRWVRYYDDAMLVDLRSGRVVDVVYDIFW